MTFILNPGTGPVENAALQHAIDNMQTFVVDAGVPTAIVTHQPRCDKDGRFSFLVEFDGNNHDVDMPGLPLEKVRYLGEPDQNIWHFPRLYVNGSSWVWKYAIGMLTKEDSE